MVKKRNDGQKLPDFEKKAIHAERERYWARRRKKILLELVSLRDDSCARFRRRFPMLDASVQKDDDAILRFRNDLQQLWRGDKPAPAVLWHWVSYAQRSHTWVIGAWADGTYSVQPNYALLPLCLAIAAGEWGRKMAICANPDCPERYFIKSRKTQRFCDRPACIAYGQREQKRNWWNEHGTTWRQKRQPSGLGRKGK